MEPIVDWIKKDNIVITDSPFVCDPLFRIFVPPEPNTPLDKRVALLEENPSRTNVQNRKIEQELAKEIEDKLLALNNERIWCFLPLRHKNWHVF